MTVTRNEREVSASNPVRQSRNPGEGSPQRPRSSPRRAEVFFSVVSVRSVVHLFLAAREEVDALCRSGGGSSPVTFLKAADLKSGGPRYPLVTVRGRYVAEVVSVSQTVTPCTCNP
jgi:hypothetical protein